MTFPCSEEAISPRNFSKFTVSVWCFAAIEKSCWTLGEGREKTHEQENTESVFEKYSMINTQFFMMKYKDFE